ncbi:MULTISPECIES: winged helix-turn-helix transcriptional regulator [unclassified Pseudoclavibacter]|jgi:DNA-binding HxlR family transcriptional regulator|uniref:winged helix-turn-helix transcriptional regulator n=1 Tax=unclassified Pseudoclavibacter TaxID=2615177 RepID=UPI000CE8E5CD|nr:MULTISPECIES: helix-turn-helix domain-containing protein [unclassified Pseudoclavibacter]MBS3179028.1 helix-turn-helix transcriptional regulator [Pseudoclavibacter sp. Marseille-Q4354]NYF11834.1 DNA-binding HxlR family transcriptional regulator [Pseudoclavibacter sp. JAI123]PPG32212.1 transcriptional regulator [Pseudoclavibacter sp. RFBB5]
MAENVQVHSAAACDGAISLAFTLLGKRWNGMIIDVLGSQPLTFVALRRAVTGISDAVLSDRLSELAAAGLVERTVSNGPPVSVSYELTTAGQRLIPVLKQLGTWASENLEPARSS